ncbi:MAG TPA: UDP-N-acetylmuramate--L-alanine ligase [Acidimicrobiales bacterium]|nr:UDP-N-acetylmuramate--L-alanine ligase [Acidimicrobiales bacterium]
MAEVARAVVSAPIGASSLDLSVPSRLHVVGIGGSGMSAIATVLVAMGHQVSGSDQRPSAVLDRLAGLGIAVTVGADPEGAAAADAVAISTAIRADDPDVASARAAGVPVLRRAEALAAICATRRTVAVSGTHGKTSTTAMLAIALREAGFEPSFIVGGDVNGIGTGAAWGGGIDGWFVVEADESDGTFLELGAEAVIVTNVEPDHLDHHGSFEALQDAFARFLLASPGPRVVCADDPVAAALATRVGGCTTYGTSEAADVQLFDVTTDRDGVSFALRAGADDLGRFRLPSPGLHNARNAAAVVTVGRALGADVEGLRRGLAAFAGVGRRFERRGEAGGVTFVDSYDHLPTEVASVLEAARAGGWDRIVCAFQPHRYTRTADLWRSFADAFTDADVVAVTDIYAAGQAPIPGVSGKLIVDAVLDAHPHQRVAWLPRRDDLRSWLVHELRPGDLCLTLGAGDLTTLPGELLPLVGGSPG